MTGYIIPETAWELSRLGRFTASEIHRLTTPGSRLLTEEELKARPKKGPGSATKYAEDWSVLSDGAMTYVREKAAEITTGLVKQLDTYATSWGKEQESHAFAALEKLYPGIIHYGMNNPQFFKYTDFSGGSLDGEQSLTRVFEVKCPYNMDNHEAYLDLKSAVELKENHKDHYCQIQMNMAIAAIKNKRNRKEMEGVFVSFDPRYPEPLQLKILVVPPDFEMLRIIDAGIEAAELELAKRIDHRKHLIAA